MFCEFHCRQFNDSCVARIKLSRTCTKHAGAGANKFRFHCLTFTVCLLVRVRSRFQCVRIDVVAYTENWMPWDIRWPTSVWKISVATQHDDADATAATNIDALLFRIPKNRWLAHSNMPLVIAGALAGCSCRLHLKYSRNAHAQHADRKLKWNASSFRILLEHVSNFISFELQF